MFNMHPKFNLGIWIWVSTEQGPHGVPEMRESLRLCSSLCSAKCAYVEMLSISIKT